MRIPSPGNPYELLGFFLSPWKSEESKGEFRNFLENSSIDWGYLLYFANLHFCAPLWFVRLQKDGLLHLLPEELQTYLQFLYEQNFNRQTLFLDSTTDLLTDLSGYEIQVILLKGGATLYNGLFEDIGARMMGDIDLLVKPHDLDTVKQVLIEKGYVPEEDTFGNYAGIKSSNAPHHLPSFFKSGSPVVVEVHFQTSRGHANRVIPTETTWENRVAIRSKELRNVYELTPTYQLLHNTVHTLIPCATYVNYSIIPLNRLADFAYLTYRHQTEINWNEWLLAGSENGLSSHFKTLMTVAKKVMLVQIPDCIPGVRFSGLHIARVSAAANITALEESRGEFGFQENESNGLQDMLPRIYIYLFRFFNRPGWIWQNQCYMTGVPNFLKRISCFSKFMYKLYLRQIFNFQLHKWRIKKIKSLLKKR